MFNKFSILTSLLVAASVVVKSEVVPSEPGPGAKYTAGQTCSVTWDGDRDSNTIWKTMSIQLMTGSNFDMVHLTTVASEQDGTISGRFTYTCPEVDPYSAIYFYQFTSPNTDVKTWTTRFTITSPSGQTVNPANPLQPGTNNAIPWGVGALADPSAARPAPVIGSAAATNGSASSTSVPSASASQNATSSARPSGSARPSANASVSGSSAAASSKPSSDSGASMPSGSFKLVALALSAISFAVAI